MILTLTPNPSLDLLYEADTLVWDDANRVEMPRRRAGGQGVNLTRAARMLGAESVALAFFGGHTGAELQSLLDDDATPRIAIPIAAETRTFVAVRETATGHALLLNPRGPVLSAEDCARMIAAAETACLQYQPDWLVCSGSIPRGIEPGFYATVAHVAHAAGARFIADCDGDALRLAVDAGCDLLAPNQHEAERLLGVTIGSIADASSAARALTRVAPRALIKLGDRGAVLADGRGCWHARGDALNGGSAVGAGDAFLAAFLVADKNGAPPEEALRKAVAAGAAVLLGHGAELLTLANHDRALASVVLTSL